MASDVPNRESDLNSVKPSKLWPRQGSQLVRVVIKERAQAASERAFEPAGNLLLRADWLNFSKETRFRTLASDLHLRQLDIGAVSVCVCSRSAFQGDYLRSSTVTTRTPKSARSRLLPFKRPYALSQPAQVAERAVNKSPSGRAALASSATAFQVAPMALPEIGSEVARRFLDRLEAHPHFQARSQWIHPDFQDGTLRLDGCLPTFYLKQIVQMIAHRTPGVRRVLNHIEVRDCLQGNCALESWQVTTAEA